MPEVIRKRGRKRESPFSKLNGRPKESYLFVPHIFLSLIKSDLETIFQGATLEYQDYENHQYIAENNNLGVVRVFQGKIYVSVPRWRNGVPSTLNILQDAKLRAFPNKVSNKIDNCEGLQNVVAIGKHNV